MTAAVESPSHFRDRLLSAGLLIDTGVAGVYGRGPIFEDVRLRFDALLTREFAADHAEAMHFSPVLPRSWFETSEYLKSFPQLAGTVFAFGGSEVDAVNQAALAREHLDWAAFQSMTDLVLMPATCYPIYPTVAARGDLPPDGVTIDPGSALVFRREPSDDPARMQMFHMRELVRIGEPATVVEWRDSWVVRGLRLLERIGLDVETDVANDPFFGRGGRMLAASQREQTLKIEIMASITAPLRTAIASFNCHQDHFATKFDLCLNGAEVHTACLGFGHERVVLALLQTHGFDPALWPAAVRTQLWTS